MHFPKIPEFEMRDLHSTGHTNAVEQTFEISDNRESVIKYAKTASIKYRGKVMEIEGEYHEMPDEYPGMPESLQTDEYDDSD